MKGARGFQDNVVTQFKRYSKEVRVAHLADEMPKNHSLSAIIDFVNNVCGEKMCGMVG